MGAAYLQAATCNLLPATYDLRNNMKRTALAALLAAESYGPQTTLRFLNELKKELKT